MTKYLTLALRQWNLAQPAWKPFLRLDQLDLGALLWVVWRSRELEGEQNVLPQKRSGFHGKACRSLRSVKS